MTHPDLETRLRAGLRAAAEAIPPVASVEDGPDGRRARRATAAPAGARPAPASTNGARPDDDHPTRAGGTARRRTMVAVAAAAAVTVVAAAAVSLAGDDGNPDVEASPVTEPSTTSSSAPTEDLGPAVDPAAGTAVVIGSDLVAFGPDGRRGATLSLAPLTGIQAVTSDRHGGWIACGDPPADGEPSSPAIGSEDDTWEVPSGGGTGTTALDAVIVPPEGEVAERIADAEAQLEDLADEYSGAAPPTSNVYRFRPDREPEPLGMNVTCMADGLGVTEVAGRDVLVYLSMADFALHTYDLASGAGGTIPVDIVGLSPGDASVGGGRLATFGPDGLRLFDLATGDAVPTGPVDLPVRAPDATTGPATTGLVLAPDGATLAAQVGEVASGPSEIVVVDLASGRELLRRQVPVTLEGSEIAYDGTTVAIGSFYEGGQVHVFDVASGAERTIEAHGLLP